MIFFSKFANEKHDNQVEMDSIYKALQDKVEIVAGRKMITPRDFDYLSARIFDKTKTYLSPITLKRFWGYLGEEQRKKPYRNTLNTLAIYAGYTSIESFTGCIDNNGCPSSEILHSPNLQTASLNKGAVIELKWSPGRCVRIRYEGHDMFRVIESQNSKLAAGDTFLCYQFIQQQPLYLRCLVHNNSAPTGYICGKEGGIHYDVVE